MSDTKLGRWMFTREIPRKGLKTRMWELWAGGEVAVSYLGLIRWSTGWRRYILDPMATAQFDATCLRDVASFLDERTREQQATWKRTPDRLRRVLEDASAEVARWPEWKRQAFRDAEAARKAQEA